MRDLDSLDSVQLGSSEKKMRWSDLVKPFAFRDNGWHLIRPFGGVWIEQRHVVTTKNNKVYYEQCHAWDLDTNDLRNVPCECCALEKANRTGSAGQTITTQKRIYINVLSYESVGSEYELKGIFLMEMSPSLSKKLKELKGANNNVSVTDPQRGAMLSVKFDRNLDPANMYSTSIDTKNVPIDPQALALSIVQKYPDGTVKKITSKDNLPPMYEYIRLPSNAEDMKNSLRVNGYYDDKGEDELSRIPAQYRQQPPQGMNDIPPPAETDMYLPGDDSMMPY